MRTRKQPKQKPAISKKRQKDRKNQFKLPQLFVGMTLKSRIILFLLLFTLIPSLIIGNVVYFVSSATIENKVSNMNDEI
ncbi:hypothetical protein, partial [Metabacillus niabensis]